MKDKYTTKQGKPTAYAYACGYVYNKNGFTLCKLHGVYYVGSFDNVAYFERLSDAYKYMANYNK